MRDRRPLLWVAIGLGIYLLAWGLWLLLAPAGGTSRVLVGDAFAYPADLGAVAACLVAARRVQAVPRTARAWRLLGLGAFAYLLGDITYNVYDAIGISPYPSVADGFYLAFYPLMLAGILAFPVTARPWRETLRLWMDITILVCSFSAFICVVTLAPNLHAPGDVLQRVFAVAYPIGDLVLAGAASIALLHGSGASVRRPLALLSAGFFVYIVGDLLYGSEALRGTYTSGGSLDTTWFVGLSLVALAAACQRPLQRSEIVDAARERVGRLPFVAVAFGFAMLVYIHRADPIFPDMVVTLLALGIAGLLSLRLFLGQRDLLSAQARLGHLALYDALTDLPNRTLLGDRLDHALARHRRSGNGLAVLIAEPDDYKVVTDTQGHAAGDALLLELTERLRGLVRTGETLARIGAAEFCVLAETIDDRGVATLAGRVLGAFAEPLTIEGRTWRVNASVGIAVADGDARTGNDLLRDADTALLRSKQTGGGFELFNAKLRDQLLRQVTLTRDLERAIREDAFDVVYQPIVSLADGRIDAVEQLIRWKHPDFDTITPGEFIPLAEKTGLIVPLGRLLFERAATQVARWRFEFPGLLTDGISVNLAGRELEEPDLAAFIDATLARHGLTSSDIELELTERVFIDEHHPIVSANLLALSISGHRLVLDDFGTGYSALSSLKRLPLWALKIDKFFTAAIHTPSDPAPVTRAVVGLGGALDIHVTAEGIETQTQLDYVRAVGVDHGQGYLLAAPQTAEDIAALLRAGGLLINDTLIAA